MKKEMLILKVYEKKTCIKLELINNRERVIQ